MEIDPMENELDYPARKIERTEHEILMILALDKLAKLGNGDRYGNSIGNMIAIRALNRVGHKDE